MIRLQKQCQFRGNYGHHDPTEKNNASLEEITIPTRLDFDDKVYEPKGQFPLKEQQRAAAGATARGAVQLCLLLQHCAGVTRFKLLILPAARLKLLKSVKFF